MNDRKEIEIEFIAVKKNFYNLKNDLDQEKVKNENLGIELINLVNENKEVSKDLEKNTGNRGDVEEQKERAEHRA